MSEPTQLGKRIVSLDQFRGYTVAGMFLVNFIGKFDNSPVVLNHHNTYCSYADTIMPGFLFAVGFAFRLTFGRRAAQQGLPSAYYRVVRRFLGLALFAVMFYHFSGMRNIFTGNGNIGTWGELSSLGFWDAIRDPIRRQWLQTLMHIALTALWLTPVIRAGALVRTLYMVGSALLHIILSYQFNFMWCNNGLSAIDGGSLGFLTWTIPAMVGTLACDAITNAEGRAPLVKLTLWSVVLMVLGYGFSCGTRLYDITPAEQVRLKELNNEIAESRKKVNGKLGKYRALLKKKEDHLKKLKIELAKLKRERLAAKIIEIRKENGLDAPPVMRLVEKAEIDEAENRLKDGAADPAITAKEEQLKLFKENGKLPIAKKKPKDKTADPKKKDKEEKNKQTKKDGKAKEKDKAKSKTEEKINQEGTIEEIRQTIRELNETLRDVNNADEYADVKLARDAIFPTKERIDALKERFNDKGWSAVLAAAPFCPPPIDDPRLVEKPQDQFQWNYWMMSQRAGTIAYLTFAAGFNLFLYVLFYILGDIIGWQIGFFRTFGMNALAGYIAHEWVGGTIKAFMPRDVPDWYMWSGLGLFMFITYLFVRHLEKQKIFLRM